MGVGGNGNRIGQRHCDALATEAQPIPQVALELGWPFKDALK